MINQRQYANSWAILTPRFQRLNPDINYNEYEKWWDKVEAVVIDDAKLIDETKSEAVVNVQLKYVMKDGRRLSDISKITLTLDSNGKWLIDDKKKL